MSIERSVGEQMKKESQTFEVRQTGWVCPQCGHALKPVTYHGGAMALNREQWESVRAGDWYCEKCKSDASKTGYKYYWNHELTGDGSRREAEHPPSIGFSVASPASKDWPVQCVHHVPIPADGEHPCPECKAANLAKTDSTQATKAHRQETIIRERIANLLREHEEMAISSVLRIRCMNHMAVPQQNANEHSGGECGACIAEERDALKAKCEAPEKERDATWDALMEVETIFPEPWFSVGTPSDFAKHIKKRVENLKAKCEALEKALREIRDRAGIYSDPESLVLAQIANAALSGKEAK